MHVVNVMKGSSMTRNCRHIADQEAAVFAADKTKNLIVRLQYNVIRAGLRRINLAYSRISLADVASRLGEHMSCRHAVQLCS
jgi:hypothetical protein